MDEVQLQVVDKDGKYRGGLFRLGRGVENIWRGKSQANPAESMVCLGPIESGAWFLLELVHREAAGPEDENDLVISASRACRRMPVQALHWFMKQEIGAPPGLLERVARFQKDWLAFCDSASANSMLAEVLRRSDLPEDDALFSDSTSREDFSLLLRLELVHQGSSGGSTYYMIDSVVQDMGIANYVVWADKHLESVAVQPRPAAKRIDEAPADHDEDVSLADAMARYDRSCDEMRTVRLNPLKAIPVDQWPEETHGRGDAIVRGQDWTRYVRYLLRVAAKNERLAEQARSWWVWWETMQVDSTTAGPEPLVTPSIAQPLRMAAAQRGTKHPTPPPAAADGKNGATSDKEVAKQANMLVTVEEAATCLDIPQRTIRNWIKKGDELQSVDRMGGPRKSATRFRLKDIEARKPEGR